MFGKKIVAVVAMVFAIAISASFFAAYEAHVVNVTAHIENALAVDPQEIEFGVVFPQEYLEKEFEIKLSDSFMSAFDSEDQRVQFVDYKIVSKPKCKIVKPCSDCPTYAAIDFSTHECPEGYEVMNDLCSFLSKMPSESETGDVGVPSYYDETTNECSVFERNIVDNIDTSIDWATGELAACGGDIIDNWTVDLKVPPVEGYVGQDWPVSCRDWVVEEDGLDYGCDLWVEVTGIYNER